MHTGPERIEPLIRQTLKGDRQAFGEIVRAFQQPIRAWAVATCPPGGDADEVAQRTFVAAFNRLKEYQPGTNFQAWLFTIARYQMMTEATRLRRLADYHSRFAPDLLQRELERRLDEEKPELIVERLDALKQCVNCLGDNARELLAWRYDESISLAEMAERTGRSVGALKKHLFQIRQKLQQCINDRMAKPEEA